MSRCGVFITVRLSSTRLPQKALLPVSGKPIISYLINRIMHVIPETPLIICTSDCEDDSRLCELAKDMGISSFQGELDNILVRHLECANTYDVDFIVNVDGDDIFCDPSVVRRIIDEYLADPSYDVISSYGYPFGTNAFGYRTEVLERVANKNRKQRIDTGWNELFRDKIEFRTKEFFAAEDQIDDVRLTLDYEEDFKIFERLIMDLGMSEHFVEQKKIIQHLKANPELKRINSHLNKQYLDHYYNRRS